MALLGKSGGAPTVGINIGSSLIKVVEAKPGKGGAQITALGVGPTPPGTIDNEVITDPQALGQAIRQLLTESGISCKRCVSSVSGQSSVVVRIIEVPKMTKQELNETMKWEVERHVPFAASEVVMDFQPIERPTTAPDDQNMEVLLAVAQQEFVNSHIDTLLAAGLQPVAIDVEPLAVCRSLIDSAQEEAPDETIAILNIGASATELGVYQNRLLTFPRTLPIAGDAVTRALSDGLNIPLAQAERLKREKSAVFMDRLEASSAVAFAPPQAADEGPADMTMGFAAPEEQADSDDLGFIPGLGFGFVTDEPEQAAEAPTVGEEDSAPMPFMDFDLPNDDVVIESVSGLKPHLDLSDEPPAAALEDSVDSASGAISLQDAEDVDLSHFTEESVFDSICPVLMDLIGEIRRSLEYYTSRFQSQPDKIFLCGGTSKIRDLDKLIQEELGIPVIVANPLQNLTVFSRTLSEDYLQEIATVFPVGVGLAIRDMIGE